MTQESGARPQSLFVECALSKSPERQVEPVHPRCLPVRLILYAWAAPTTLLGLTAGLVTLATGGKVQRRRGALEFYGGFATWGSRRIGFLAMTLGHVILGSGAAELDLVRDHEQAHVRQAEAWGPAFIPAYLLASVLAWRRGGHYYRDNWFERDARRAAGEPE
ncbi:MAG: hypothetical protein ACP5XB_21945 [Isosphaeraceae bacterium]